MYRVLVPIVTEKTVGREYNISVPTHYYLSQETVETCTEYLQDA